MHPRASQVALMVKEPTYQCAGDIKDSALIPELVRDSGRGHGNSTSVLLWRILWMRSLWWAAVRRWQESDTTEVTYYTDESNLLKQPLNIEYQHFLCIFVDTSSTSLDWALTPHSCVLQAHLCCVSTVLRTRQLSGWRSHPWGGRGFHLHPWVLVLWFPPLLLSHDSLSSPALDTLLPSSHYASIFPLFPASLILSVKVD